MDKRKWMMYVKAVAAILAAGYAVAFVVFNAGVESHVWLAPLLAPRRVPTLVVIIVTVVLTLAIVWAGRAAMRIWPRRARKI